MTAYRSPLQAAMLAAACTLLFGCGKSQRIVTPECPSARVITKPSELLSGSVTSRGALGDIRIENDRIRVVVQQAGRDWMGGIRPYGGTIIDADIQRPDGSPTQVNFEASALGINIETIPNYQDVTILNDGSNCEPAVVRATGPLDLFEYANPSSVIRNMGLTFPDSADDQPLPVEIQTDYILAQGDDFVREETTVINLSGDDIDIFLVEYLSGSGEVDAFIPGMGFGEPLTTTSCPLSTWVPCARDGSCDPCNFLAFSGYDGGLGVSYARIHPYFGGSTFNVTGINVMIYGLDVLPVVLGVGEPNFTVPANGELFIERWFAVVPGSVASVQRVRDQIFGIDTGGIEGRVTAGGAPLTDAIVAVYRQNENTPLFDINDPDAQALIENLDPDAIEGLIGDNVVGNVLGRQPPGGLLGAVLAPELDVVSQERTDADGRFRFDLPPGTYTVHAYKAGHNAASPGPSEITVSAGSDAELDFTLPSAGRLQVFARDGAGRPIPAKVQLVGFNPNPPLANRQNILGVIETRAGVFFDQFVRDPVPFGISFVDFIGVDGELPARDIEPGEYEIVVSRGPRWSAFRQRVTVAENALAVVDARLAQVMDTPGFIYGDFHVHAADSLDARVNREDRVLTYLGEGMDFFALSDHGIQVDYQPVINAAGASALLGTAPGGEMTTFDYGHFNAWPRTVTDNTRGRGYPDWGFGDAVPPGQHFPAFGAHPRTPEQLVAIAKNDPLTRPTVQINHIESHFGAAGLRIDTAQTPPQSTFDPVSRRLPPLPNLFTDSFDALEIWIGVNGRAAIMEALDTNMADWFNLINQGIVRTGVASSDTHTRRLTAMATRSMVASSVTDPRHLSARAQALADTVSAGHVVMTNAPFLSVSARAPSTGQRAGLGINDSRLLATTDGRVDVDITVTSPAWAEFDRIELFVNHTPAQTNDDPPRYTVCPDVTLRAGDDFTIERVVVDPAVPAAERLQTSLTVPLDNLDVDSWFVVRLAGTDGVSEPMFPVEPQALSPNGNGTLEDITGSNLGQGGILATAVSNPLFIDVTGDGRWNPPGVRLGTCP